MIHIRLPGIPISMDHAYESVVRGKGPKRITVRRLSDAGKRYKAEVKKHIVKHHPEALNFFMPNHPYLLVIQLTFKGRESLYNMSWLELDPKKQAKSRYKRLDASNRIKLCEDALAEAVGIDDKHNFFVGMSKTWARDYEATDIWVFNRDLERDNPIDALINQLRSGQAQPNRAVPDVP